MVHDCAGAKITEVNREFNDLGPVALTSTAMKRKWVVLWIQTKLPTTIIMINNIYEHIEQAQSQVKIVFMDFSNAFNTIQPLDGEQIGWLSKSQIYSVD